MGEWGEENCNISPYPRVLGCPDFLLQAATCWKAGVETFIKRPVGTRSSPLSSHLCVLPSKATPKETRDLTPHVSHRAWPWLADMALCQ